MSDFSYNNYHKLIETISSTIPLRDFATIKETDRQFFILRHDVEFSVEKAYELAKFEHDTLGIQSSYFFQIRNYTYNPFAFQNIKLINEIHDMGHKIGLHVNMCGLGAVDNSFLESQRPAACSRDPGILLTGRARSTENNQTGSREQVAGRRSPSCQQTLTSFENITDFIKNDALMLQNMLGLSIDRFSFHRPTHEQLAADIKVDGLINAYDKLFFQFYEKPPAEAQTIYYFSDSEHRWKYGSPLSILEKPVKKLQLLIHPYSWSKQGLDNFNNFKEIINMKQGLMLQAMQDECHHFPNELLIHEKI